MPFFYLFPINLAKDCLDVSAFVEPAVQHTGMSKNVHDRNREPTRWMTHRKYR